MLGLSNISGYYSTMTPFQAWGQAAVSTNPWFGTQSNPQSPYTFAYFWEMINRQQEISNRQQEMYNRYIQQSNNSDNQTSAQNVNNNQQAEKSEAPSAPKETSAPSAPVKPKEQKLTKQLKDQIIAGTYSGQYVKVNGVTHYRYSDCAKADRVSVGNGQQLHKSAAAAFNKMKAAAAKDGISLHVHSGLRTVATQKGLFSSKMKTKGRSFEQNVVWSAPANFSEHHTGLAMDINCASTSFGKSKEYKWLKAHAKDFGFELSFPENNAQGIGFEPWHWRYVGKNEEFKSVFAAARGNDPRFS